MKEIELTKEQQEELQKIVDDISNDAKQVVQDYTHTPSKMSGTITSVHENSPLLDAD